MPLLAPPVGGTHNDPALAQDAQMSAAFDRASMARAESYQTFVRGLPSLADEADVSGLLDPTRTDGMGGKRERLSSGRRKKGGAPVHPAPAPPIPAHLAGIMRDADVDALAAAATRSQSESRMTTTEAEFHAERARLADFARALEDYIRTPADDFLEQRQHVGGGSAGAAGAARTVGAGGRGAFVLNDDDDGDDENEAMIRAFKAAAMAGDADYYAPSLHHPSSPPAPAAAATTAGRTGGGLDEDGIEEEAIDQGQTPFFLESPKMAGDARPFIHRTVPPPSLNTALSRFF